MLGEPTREGWTYINSTPNFVNKKKPPFDTNEDLQSKLEEMEQFYTFKMWYWKGKIFPKPYDFPNLRRYQAVITEEGPIFKEDGTERYKNKWEMFVLNWRRKPLGLKDLWHTHYTASDLSCISLNDEWLPEWNEYLVSPHNWERM